MVIKMRYLLFFFFLFLHSHVVFSQAVPNCMGDAGGANDCGFAGGNPARISNGSAACTGNTPPGYFVAGGACASDSNNPQGAVYKCWASCACPEGFKLNTIVSAGLSVTSCFPDTTDPSDDQCVAPQVNYMGLCRDAEDEPEDCGETYSTAVAVDGSYVCTNDENCGDGTSPTILTTPTGSWKVCGGGGDEPDPEEPPSSAPPSSAPSTGDGDDGDGGDGGGSGDGSGGDSGSGSGTSAGGQSSSASGGGGGNPPTQSASSTSSGANGWASSGSGAGNCDPTDYDYLDCISRDNPGEGGDGIGDINQEGYEMDIHQRLQEARDKYTQKIDEIKSDFEQQMSVSIGTGAGGLPSNTITMYGQSFEAGIAARSDFFELIRWAFFAAATVLAVYIVLSR